MTARRILIDHRQRKPKAIVNRVTGIDWAGGTSVAQSGCSRASRECMNCYAEDGSVKLQEKGHELYRDVVQKVGGEWRWTGRLNFNPEVPRSWVHLKEPTHIFINSMSDTFHENAPFEWIEQTFAGMVAAHWHIFMVLTKRAERMEQLAPLLPWPKNVWMGVSVGTRDALYREDHLRRTPALTKFLSCEPLLEPLADKLNLEGIDWVIVGGESGPRWRPMEEQWARDLRDLCVRKRTAFFFKQYAGFQPKRDPPGRKLDGREWNQFPKPK